MLQSLKFIEGNSWGYKFARKKYKFISAEQRDTKRIIKTTIERIVFWRFVNLESERAKTHGLPNNLLIKFEWTRLIPPKVKEKKNNPTD